MSKFLNKQTKNNKKTKRQVNTNQNIKNTKNGKYLLPATSHHLHLCHCKKLMLL